MTKVVSLFPPEKKFFGPRQFPVAVDDTLTVVMQFENICEKCDCSKLQCFDFKGFTQRFQLFSRKELASILVTNIADVFTMLSQFVTCVGCRRSVQRFFGKMMMVNDSTLEPLFVTTEGHLTIDPAKLRNCDANYLCNIFHGYGPALNDRIESIPKTKKSRRCLLHSLDGQRMKQAGWSWNDVWDILSEDCQDKILLVSCDMMQETVENYLRKHRFCGECKSKVMRAYSILIGEVDCSKEKGYSASIYGSVKFCAAEKHVHVSKRFEYVTYLMNKAEPELKGSGREKHAKTIEIAQEEVITCIGICLYERVNLIWQRMREEEQTWQILSYLGVSCLRKNFELAVEDKQGYSQLEFVCEQISRAEQAKKQKRELKRQRKKRKNRAKADAEPVIDDSGSLCDCNENSPDASCQSCCNDHRFFEEDADKSCESDNEEFQLPGTPVCKDGICCVDCSCTSGNKDSLSSSSSCDYSAEHCCNHEGRSTKNRHACNSCQKDQVKYNSKVRGNRYAGPNGYNKQNKPKLVNQRQIMPISTTLYGTVSSLEDMLEDPCLSGEEECIPAEEVQEFRARMCQVSQKRQELRKLLRQRFANLQKCSKIWCKPTNLRWSLQL